MLFSLPLKVFLFKKVSVFKRTIILEISLWYHWCTVGHPIGVIRAAVQNTIIDPFPGCRTIAL